MKNYGIEIEIIDKSGKNINGKEFICKINDKEVSENKDGMFLLKEKIEEVGEKNSYKIECADKTINVNVVLRDNNEIDIKKLKLNIIKDGKKVNVEEQTLVDNIAWKFNKKNQMILIKIISEKVEKGTTKSEKSETKKDVTTKKSEDKQDKIDKIIEKAKKAGSITYGELALELGDVTPEQIEEVFEKFEKNGINIYKEETDDDEPDLEDLEEVEEIKLEEITIIVPSLRLDNFVSDLARTSRSKAVQIIDSERVFINGQNETKASKQVKLGDVITIRGKGRFVVKEFSGSTRSGRTVIKIEKYI